MEVALVGKINFPDLGHYVCFQRALALAIYSFLYFLIQAMQR